MTGARSPGAEFDGRVACRMVVAPLRGDAERFGAIGPPGFYGDNAGELAVPLPECARVCTTGSSTVAGPP